MALGELIGFQLPFNQAVLAAGLGALLSTFVAMPKVIRKLRGAGIIGRDINKPTRPEVPEMGGIGVFLGFYTGVFTLLILHPLDTEAQILVLVSLITAAGAAMTGVIDDLVELRQRFKAFIPIVFAAPLAVYVTDHAVRFPLLGTVDFGLLYPLVLVPLGIACASNGFNILEGYNGMGAGLGIIMTLALIALVWIGGDPQAYVLLFPLLGALIAFLWFNRYPARVFPGDTLTLLVGAVLASAAIIGKVEFWGALLFAPHIIEFFLKAKGGFAAENFAKRLVPNGAEAPRLEYEGPTESLTHVILKRWRPTEPGITAVIWSLQAALALGVVLTFLASRGAPA